MAKPRFYQCPEPACPGAMRQIQSISDTCACAVYQCPVCAYETAVECFPCHYAGRGPIEQPLASAEVQS